MVQPKNLLRITSQNPREYLTRGHRKDLIRFHSLPVDCKAAEKISAGYGFYKGLQRSVVINPSLRIYSRSLTLLGAFLFSCAASRTPKAGNLRQRHWVSGVRVYI